MKKRGNREREKEREVKRGVEGKERKRKSEKEGKERKVKRGEIEKEKKRDFKK